MSQTTHPGPIFEADHPAFVATDGVRVEMPWGHLRVFTGMGSQPSETTVAICHVDAGMAVPLHYHANCEETIHVLSGRCEHRYGQDTLTLEPGQTLLIPRDVVHRAAAVGGSALEFLMVFSSGQREVVFLE
jgi:quercetin dioxygenase-like cupin family protein